VKDPLDDAFGLPPMERPEPEITVPESISDDGDYEFARRNLYRLGTKGEDALDELREIAAVSQHARAYEVYSNLFKAVVDANRDVMALKKTHREVSGGSGPKTVNNTLVMTSDEVLRLLKDKK